MRIAVVRPQPGADATAARLAALGHVPLVHPLLATRALAWALPAAAHDAIILSSAAAARHAGPGADAVKALPAHAVGAATAAAARAAGWADVRTGPGTMQALLDALPAGRFLHLAGADLTPVSLPDHISLTRVTVYDTPLQPLPGLIAADAVLLHSPRSARHFAAEWDRLGGRRGTLALFAISAATLAAAGDGWASAQAAPDPSEAALLAMLPKAL